MSENVGMVPRLTPKQVMFAEFLAQPERSMTQVEFGESIGVGDDTLSKWKRNKELQELIWSLTLADVKTDKLANVWRGLVKAAERGDSKASKLVFEMMQKYAPPGVLNVGGDLTVNVVSSIPHQQPIVIDGTGTPPPTTAFSGETGKGIAEDKIPHVHPSIPSDISPPSEELSPDAEEKAPELLQENSSPQPLYREDGTWSAYKASHKHTRWCKCEIPAEVRYALPVRKNVQVIDFH